MTAPIEDAEGLCEYWEDTLGWLPDAPAMVKVRALIAAARADRERLAAVKAERDEAQDALNIERPRRMVAESALARAMEAMPSEEEWDHMQAAREEDRLNAECPGHIASNAIIDHWLDRLDAFRASQSNTALTFGPSPADALTVRKGGG